MGATKEFHQQKNLQNLADGEPENETIQSEPYRIDGDKSVLFNALVSLQKDLKNLEPLGKGYNYKYVKLDQLYDELRAIAKKYDLSVFQMFDMVAANQIKLTTLVAHKDGSSLTFGSNMIFNPATEKQKGIQMYGSAVTYLRRYVLGTFFGIGTEHMDDDGEAVSGQRMTRKPDFNAPRS